MNYFGKTGSIVVPLPQNVSFSYGEYTLETSEKNTKKAHC